MCTLITSNRDNRILNIAISERSDETIGVYVFQHFFSFIGELDRFEEEYYFLENGWKFHCQLNRFRLDRSFVINSDGFKLIYVTRIGSDSLCDSF